MARESRGGGTADVMRWQRSLLGFAALLLAFAALVPARAAAPSGRVVYVGSDGGLYLVPLAGGSAQEIWRPVDGGSAAEPRWSPDGTRIAFVGGDGNLWLINADGSKAHPLTDQAVPPSGCTDDFCQDEGARIDSPRWSPDGSAISYRLVRNAATASLWIVPVAGGAPRQLAQASSLCLFNEGFAPDGTPLYSRCPTTTDTTNATYAVARNGPTGLLGGSQIAYTPDGTMIAYARQTFSDAGVSVGLYVAAPDGSNARLVAPDGQEPLWSPDGRLAYIVESANGPVIHVLDPTSGSDAVVAQGQPWGWSPDGAWLVYTAIDNQGNSAIMRVHGDGSSAALITYGRMPAISSS